MPPSSNNSQRALKELEKQKQNNPQQLYFLLSLHWFKPRSMGEIKDSLNTQPSLYLLMHHNANQPLTMGGWQKYYSFEVGIIVGFPACCFDGSDRSHFQSQLGLKDWTMVYKDPSLPAAAASKVYGTFTYLRCMYLFKPISCYSLEIMGQSHPFHS